jgi:hypothetical protein
MSDSPTSIAIAVRQQINSYPWKIRKEHEEKHLLMKVFFPPEAVFSHHQLGYCLDYMLRIRGREVVEDVDWRSE